MTPDLLVFVAIGILIWVSGRDVINGVMSADKDKLVCMLPKLHLREA